MNHFEMRPLVKEEMLFNVCLFVVVFFFVFFFCFFLLLALVAILFS